MGERRRGSLAAAAAAVSAAAALACTAWAGGAERGTAGDDRVVLGNGPDRFLALAGDDRIRGEGGRDTLLGGRGDDRLIGGRGSDELSGGPGADRLNGRDGGLDRRIAGGPGRDVCVIDARERNRVSGCEVVRPPADPDPPVDPPPDPEPRPEPAESDAFRNRNWQPTPYDTCSKALHEGFSVVGPDGKLYPAWHPPELVDPATGETCSFGHEHGADPSGSDIYDWVAAQGAAPGYEDRAGIPFGYASEALVEYSAANPSVATRFEDHVGHKIDYVNDVDLLDTDGRYVLQAGERVSCDYLFKVHQGSHSPDATLNNAHELLFAARCSDGTELLTTTMARFGAPNEFNRSCSPATAVTTGSGPSPYPAGSGTRLIPDRACIEEYVLIPPAQTNRRSDIWALYENWTVETELTTAGGDVLASFDPWFAIRNPSRYALPGSGIGRTLDAAWETDAADGGVANADPWSGVQPLAPFEHRDPRSPFDGAQRDFYLQDVEVDNEGGATRIYTDPYGGNASATPFPGGICQIVSATDNTAQPELKRRLFGRDDDYGAGNGVHSPN